MSGLIPLFLEGSVWQSVRAPGLAVTLLHSPLAPLPRSPLPTTASPRYALPSPCLWPSQVPALPPALACPAVPSLHRGAVACCSSLFRVSSNHYSSANSPHGRLGPGTDQECYFLLVVDDYTHYTTVFPLRCKADVSGVLIPWIHATRRLLRERFRRDVPVLRLLSDRGGELTSDLLVEFYRDECIHQSFTLLASPQQNGIVRYVAHQLNLWPRVSEPETSPTLRWTGKVGNASVFRVWGALSLVCDAKASKLSSRTPRCVFLGFPTDAPLWQFYHPCLR
ncbi:unnamed protein product [Closterium sp. NIES-53]